MYHKNKLFIVALAVLFLLAVSSAAASENTTQQDLSDVSHDEDLIQDNSSADTTYNAEIVARDMTLEYSQDGNDFNVRLNDFEGNEVYPDSFVALWDGKTIEYAEIHKNHYSFDASSKPVGNHKVVIWVVDSYYFAPPVEINVKIVKAPVKLTAERVISKSAKYCTFKATVKDKRGLEVEEGIVRFTINSKSYWVHVNGGVAIKKVALKKVKSQVFRVRFYSIDYKSKSATSKIFIKKPKTRYVRVGKYAAKLPQKKYKYLKRLSKLNKIGKVTLKCRNVRGCTITVKHYTSHYSKLNGRHYQKGFYASVWKRGVAKAVLKIKDRRIRI